MECYHPENNAWTDMPSMRYCRSGAGVAVLNQYIFVVGGFDGARQLSSVERFDTDRQAWETITPMKISRSALSVNVIDGKLYAMVSCCYFLFGFAYEGILYYFRAVMMARIFLRQLKFMIQQKTHGKMAFL